MLTCPPLVVRLLPVWWLVKVAPGAYRLKPPLALMSFSRLTVLLLPSACRPRLPLLTVIGWLTAMLAPLPVVCSTRLPPA